MNEYTPSTTGISRYHARIVFGLSLKFSTRESASAERAREDVRRTFSQVDLRQAVLAFSTFGNLFHRTRESG
jgi:hypothetical protein